MSSFPILDLVIGMIFIFFLLSIICSSAVELWLSIRRTRATTLAQWLKAIFNLQALDAHGVPMLGKDGKPVVVGQAIIDDCMITALSPRGKSNSYLSAENFVTALLDKVSVADPLKDKEAQEAKDKFGFIPPPESLEEYISRIKQTKVISAELQRTFLQFAYEARKAASAPKDLIPAQNITNNISSPIKSELEIFRDRLEQWYDMNSDRLTGTLKRKALPITIIAAILITIGLNVDTVEISRYLYINKEVAAKLAESVDNYVKTHQQITQTSAPELRASLDTLKVMLPSELPLGWEKNKKDWKHHVWGWIATILAIIMGAPFWFDILNKIANLRNTGPKPAPADDKKEDK